MKLPPKTGQRIAGPAIVAVALIAAGAGAVAVTSHVLTAAQAERQAARALREAQQNELARVTDEANEVRERLVDYQKLVARGVVGADDGFDRAL